MSLNILYLRYWQVPENVYIFMFSVLTSYSGMRPMTEEEMQIFDIVCGDY